METKIELRRISGEVFFSHECEDNSVAKTIHSLRVFGPAFDLRYADFRHTDLRNADLSGANLRDANLVNANLGGADLRYTDLQNADFRYANLGNDEVQNTILRYANLRNANLGSTNLKGADLRYTDLRYTNLRNANLRNAYLGNSNLSGADFRGANLSGADLRYANLGGSYLGNSDLSNISVCEKTAFILPQCPSEGSFVAWKKAEGKIIKLLVTEDAKRSSATTMKCRCSKAKVLAIEEIDGSESELKEVTSKYSYKFVYRVGETVEVADFDDDRWNECSTGIHFFIAREMAVNY